MRPFSKYWIISVLILLASFANMPTSWADACNCKVTSPSSSTDYTSPECTLYKVLVGGCPAIVIDASVVKDGKPQFINLPEMISLTGVTIEGPALSDKVTPGVNLTFDSSSNFADAILIRLKGKSTLKMLGVSAPGKTAIQSVGSDANSLQNVVISKSKVGVELLGSGLSILGGAVGNNETGILVTKTGAGLYIDKDKSGVATEIQNNTVGVDLIGNTNVILSARIHDNATGVKIDGQLGLILQSEFYGNTADAIKLNGDANGKIQKPQVLAVLTDTADPSHYSIVVSTPATVDVVEGFVADASKVSQGKTFLEQGVLRTFKNPLISGSTDKVFVVRATGQNLGQSVALTAISYATGTSEFVSATIQGNAVETAGPSSCDSQEWFMSAVANGQDPWSADFDGDTFPNGQEDKNHDCYFPNMWGMAWAYGESDPAVFSKPLFKFPDFKIPNPCADNPDLCKIDTDKDGVEDGKDNCPSVANAPAMPNGLQDDVDSDGLGDACDPDMDNDGLGNRYCNPPSDNPYTDTKDCSLSTVAIGVDQETPAGTDRKNPDKDGDHYCDGPGFGPIVNGKPTACTKGFSDNCPTADNNTQWDEDEDGIGNACDDSQWALQGGSVALRDSDHDGFYEYTAGNQLRDNCPAIANPADPATGKQTDTDGDGRGDACDSDDDNDGVLDVVENSTRYKIIGNGGVVYVMMNPLSADSDVSIDPTTKAVTPDPDGSCDGAGPGPKKADGTFICTKPADQCPVLTLTGECNVPGSSWTVTLEDKNLEPGCPFKHFDILSANGEDIACNTDMDGDGVKNWDEDAQLIHFWEPDSDHYYKVHPTPVYDGYCDGTGAGPKLNPFNPQAPTDCKLSDICPAIYNPGNPQPDLCHKAQTVDKDGDGIPDGKDNCLGIPNSDQNNLDGDPQGDACDSDIDGDGLPNDADKCAKFKDPSNACVGANPGGSKTPPPSGTPPPTPGITSVMQGGGSSCTLLTGATSTAQVLPTLVMFLAPLLAMILRRRHNPE